MRKRQTAKQMQAKCDRFDREHPVGTVIKCWPGVREGAPVERTVREPGAMILSGHTPVVFVEGGGGCIALSHIQWGAN